MTTEDSKKIALFADIHSNQEALESILNEISKHNYKDIYCLGDLVGCGPSPNECLLLSAKHKVKYLFGNHDIVVLNGKKVDHCDEPDRDALFAWMREQLSNEAWDYLRSAKVSETLDLPGGKVKLEHFLSHTEDSDCYPYHSRKRLADGEAQKIIANSDCKLTINAHLHSRVTDIFASGNSLRFLLSSGCTGYAKTFYYTLDIETLKLERVFVDYNVDSFVKKFEKLPIKDFKQKLDRMDYYELQSTSPDGKLFKLYQIFDKMSDIQYGYVDKNGKRHVEDLTNFSTLFALQSSEEVHENKLGVCWDQVEYERDEFEKADIKYSSFFIVYYNEDKCPTHTFMLCEINNHIYWFENSWSAYRGIYRFQDINEALRSIREKFIHLELGNTDYNPNNLCIYKYNEPQAGLGCLDFYKHCEAGENIKDLD